MDRSQAQERPTPAVTRPHVHYEGKRPPFLRYLLPSVLVGRLWRDRALLRELSRTRFSAGHREDFLGMAWLVLEPLMMLAVYSVVFILIFKASWRGAESELLTEGQRRLMRVLCLYAGIVTYQMFAQTLGASANVIRNAKGYVKLMVFPTETLPASVVGGIFVPSVIGYGLLLTIALIGGVGIGWELCWLPVVLAPMVLFILGLAWFMAALCVFVPDVRTMTALITRFGFFLTPIVYPLPEKGYMRSMLLLNPLTVIVESVRRVMLFGQPPMWRELLPVSLFALVVCQLGFAFFMRSKRWFADVV